MSLRYPCLVVDHDDTSVLSTPSIHYPAHVEALRRLRPGQEPVSLEGFMKKNFDPGFFPFISEEIGLNREEIAASYEVWREFTSSRVPEFFPGILELYAEHKAHGGILVVVSHSDADMIARDYRSAGAAGERAMPDLVFGWTDDPETRKPHPYPLFQTMARFGLAKEELLVLDDLKPGADMAAAAGVDFAAAGWGHSIAEIRTAFKASCRFYFERVEDLKAVIL